MAIEYLKQCSSICPQFRIDCMIVWHYPTDWSQEHQCDFLVCNCLLSKLCPPWAAALTLRRGLIPSEPSASAERDTGRLSAAQLGGLVWSLADSHRVVRTRLVLGFGDGLWAHIVAWSYGAVLYRPAPLWYWYVIHFAVSAVQVFLTI